MSYNSRDIALAFAQFLPSMVKLDELQKMTEDLDQELAESQKIMKEIKAMFDSVPKTSPTNKSNGQDNILKQEDMSQFLEANVPKLLMPDMPENTVDVDLDRVISTMKSYAEDLKKKIVTSQSQPMSNQRKFENLDLEQYAKSFDQLAKRLANVKLNKKDGANNRNADLELKLAQLCQDVHLFNQMVETKTSLSESNKNWTNNQLDNALYYDNIINKLLNGINEVTYLLKSKN
ncbi:unnamed protein product [Parnassius apollo]|uniref:(apollo) hypothetical protein n=1 Tax=Parnassius apollo TaxID=110799 RepID=A0A8S3XPK5_PARAO|nr:unnamed protein product [Parnassius apollo]